MKEEGIKKSDCGPPTRKVFCPPNGSLDPVEDGGSTGEGASSAILFEDGPMVYLANAFDSHLRCD